ncbi:MAG: hypothetical protein WBD10_12055 [Acidobacteriaceae bacterium]
MLHPIQSAHSPKGHFPGMIDTRLNNPIALPDSNESKIPAPLAETVRRLSHDLSNALEVILQTNYLLGMGGDSTEEDTEKWREMLNRGVAQATKINRELRDFVRANS